MVPAGPKDLLTTHAKSAMFARLVGTGIRGNE